MRDAFMSWLRKIPEMTKQIGLKLQAILQNVKQYEYVKIPEGSGMAIFRMKKIEIYRHHDTIL